MKLLFASLILLYSAASFCKTVNIESYVGNWSLTKGEKDVCPDRLSIKKVFTGKVEVENIRAVARAKMLFEIGKTLQGKHSLHYSKKKKPSLKHDYTMHTQYSTGFINGRLVSSHLWVSPELSNGTSTATKVISIKDKKTMTLEKVFTGYGTSDMDPSTDKDIPSSTFAKHDNDFSLATAGDRCEFTKK